MKHELRYAVLILIGCGAVGAAAQSTAQAALPMAAHVDAMSDVVTSNPSGTNTSDTVDAGVRTSGSSGLRYSWSRGLRYKTADDAFGVRVSGVLQFDAAHFNADREPLHDGSELHRGRLALSGNVAREFRYRVEGDFTGSKPTLVEGFVRYSGWRHLGLTAGLIKEPFGLEWQTSSKNITFLERALPTALIPGYHAGVRADAHGSSWSATAGAFGGGTNGNDPRDHGRGASARLTYAPVHRDGLTLHLGASGAYRETDKQFDRLHLASRPEAHLADVNFVDSRTIRGVDSSSVLGVEAAGVAGPLSLQSEYVRTFVQRSNGRSELQFDGWYAYGSWFITGESRDYDAHAGKFRAVAPHCALFTEHGLGAWEVAVRYSHIDLNDQRVNGGAESDVTYALNWYPAVHVRLMADYVAVQTDANATGRKNRGRDSPSIVELRLQVEF